MAPKAKVTRDMIVAAAVEVARRDGHESINARTVAQQLSCSTQPVMYHFATIEELKRAAFARADRLHTEYLLQSPAETDPLLAIGLHYIRFAVEEPQLFRFLFQSGYTEEKSLKEIFDSEELTPILAALRAELGGDAARAREVFLILALFTHGYASLYANNDLSFDEKQAAAHLERAFCGAVAAAAKEEAP